MKKKDLKVIIILLTCGLLAGCAKEQVSTTTEEQETQTVAAEKQESTDSQEGAVSEACKSINHGNYGEVVHIPNPSWDYYIAKDTESKVKPITLNKLTEEANEIIDEDKWFLENNITEPTEDGDAYICLVERADYSEGCLLNIFDKVTGTQLVTLDFSDYCFANDSIPENEAFVEQQIVWTKIEGNTLYLSVGHNTYAESSPHHAYIMAIDLTDMSVMWKTEPLTSNARDFELIGDIIFSGYGFTAEKDYLKQIDKSTGKVLEQIPLKSMAEYIIQKEDILYVRTYDTNYTFHLEK